VLGSRRTAISLNMLVYPNPTTDYFNTSCWKHRIVKSKLSTYDSRGQLIESKQQITATNEAIRTVDLPSALYFESYGQQGSKGFKIIKK
jgi:hypothetical protein